MALTPHLSAARRAAMLDTITASAAGGLLRIYSDNSGAAPQPSSPEVGIGTAILLATLTMGSPAFGSATSTASTPSVLTANAITQDSSADTTGTAAWFRLWQSNGTTAILDGSVGTATADLIINSTSISAGAAVSASSFTLTLAV